MDHLVWLLLVLLATLAAASHSDSLAHVASAHGPDAGEFSQALFSACLADPVCRSVHDQEHGEISATYFDRLTRALRPAIHAAVASRTDDADGLARDLAVALLIVHNTYLAEERCPPNAFWHYDAASGAGTCKCYFDRDCDIFAAGVCEDTTHNVLLVTTAILVLFVAGITLLFCIDIPPLPGSAPAAASVSAAAALPVRAAAPHRRVVKHIQNEILYDG